MRLRTWLIVGGLAGLAAGLPLDTGLHLPTLDLLLMQAPLIAFGALVAAFAHEGARSVTGGGEPKHDRGAAATAVAILPNGPAAPRRVASDGLSRIGPCPFS